MWFRTIRGFKNALKEAPDTVFFVPTIFKVVTAHKNPFYAIVALQIPPGPIYPQNQLCFAISENAIFGSYHASVKNYGPIRKSRPKFENWKIDLQPQQNPFFSNVTQFQRNPRCALESLRHPLSGKYRVVGSIPTRFDRKSGFSNFSKKSGRPPPRCTFWTMANFFSK